MTPTTRTILKAALSSVVAAIIAATGVVQTSSLTTGGDIPDGVILGALLTGLAAAAKDVQAALMRTRNHDHNNGDK